MYTINRQQAAEILWVSTRSIDRYIKAWKIRAKKVWKQVLLNNEDIKILSWDTQTKQKIIIENDILEKKENIVVEKKEKQQDTNLVKKEDYEKLIASFEKIYTGFRQEIRQKDEKIQELSLELWKYKEQLNNKIDLIEYKKVQFLSEEHKKSLQEKLEQEKKEKEKLNKDLKYEKTTNKLLILFIIILFIISIWIFVMKI